VRFLIFGATGGTGKQLVGQALERGDEVTAFIRTPTKMSLAHPRLRKVQGDITDPESIRRAVPGHTAVLSALGTKPFQGPTTVLSEALKEILAAMEASNMRRMIWESTIGIGDTRGQLGPLYGRILIPLLLRHIFDDKERQEAILRASPLEWVIVQPGTLTNGPLTRKYRAGRDVCRDRRLPRISRADVAHFMLNEATHPANTRQSVALCY
jgi:putative NADH-flavin reductase